MSVLLKNVNTFLLFLFLSLLFCTGQAKFRGKFAAKFKRGLQNAMTERKTSPKMAELRRGLRHKRDIMENNNSKESDEFKAEIKFLEKWNPSMTDKESSAYRLFRGNVLDAVLEQLDGDGRFLSSYVLELKNISGGILARIGFHFKKSENSPISHMRFIVSRGHLSSLKVDKKYFKVIESKDQIKAPSQNQSSPQLEQLAMQAQTLGIPQASQQTQTAPQSQGQPPNKNLDQIQIQGLLQSEEQPQTVTATDQSQDNRQNQVQTNSKDQQQNQISNPSKDQSQDQIQAQSQSQISNQNETNSIEHAPNVSPNTASDQSQTHSSDQSQTNSQTHSSDQSQTVQPQAQSQTQSENQPSNQAQIQTQPKTQSDTQLLGQQQVEAQSQSETQKQVETQPNSQSQSNSQLGVEAPLSESETAEPLHTNTHAQGNPQTHTSSSLKLPLHDTTDENILIKMNQAWYPFLSNHESAQYKMLAGNLEKGLKVVLAEDDGIIDIKVKDLIKAEVGMTKVKLSMKFDAKKGNPADKLKSIVKTGDIAGIPVDSNFFEITEDNQIAMENKLGSNEVLSKTHSEASKNQFPKSCDEVKSLGIGTKDGEYVIEARPGCHLNIICQNMNEQHAKEFLGGPQQKYWLYWPYAALVKLSDRDKKNISEGSCLEKTDDGKAFLSRMITSKAKQGNPSTPWKDNVKKILKS